MMSKQIYVAPAVREIGFSAGTWHICSASFENYLGKEAEYDDDSD